MINLKKKGMSDEMNVLVLVIAALLFIGIALYLTNKFGGSTAGAAKSIFGGISP